ncbi:MAG: DinB family protein [Acidobacteriota bacterium]|nr:DinB family protein [Acidobacteriota bacterium]
MGGEAWLNGKLEGYAPLLMPAALALTQANVDLQKFALDLSGEELTARPNGAPSAAFHLRHIAGSIDRLLTYSRGEQLDEEQFAALKAETADEANFNAAELTRRAVAEINNALEVLKNADLNKLFEERFVGRQKLPTNVFGLLFHIAEHTARHVGQVVTTAAIVRKRGE